MILHFSLFTFKTFDGDGQSFPYPLQPRVEIAFFTFRDAGYFAHRAVVKVVEVEQHLVVGLQRFDGSFHEFHAVGVVKQGVGLIVGERCRAFVVPLPS